MGQGRIPPEPSETTALPASHFPIFWPPEPRGNQFALFQAPSLSYSVIAGRRTRHPDSSHFYHKPVGKPQAPGIALSKMHNDPILPIPLPPSEGCTGRLCRIPRRLTGLSIFPNDPALNEPMSYFLDSLSASWAKIPVSSLPTPPPPSPAPHSP